jgi:hypothetical protein
MDSPFSGGLGARQPFCSQRGSKGTVSPAHDRLCGLV